MLIRSDKLTRSISRFLLPNSFIQMLSGCHDDHITRVRVYVALNCVDKWRKNGHDAILHFPRLPI